MAWAAVFLMELLVIYTMFMGHHAEAHFSSLRRALDETTDRVWADIEEWFLTHDDDNDGDLKRLIDSRWNAYEMFSNTRTWRI